MAPRILVVGSGGREHALVNALARSPQEPELFATPGNPGIAEQARCFDCPVSDIEGIVHLSRDERIDFVVIGPEAPLVDGLVDRLVEEKIPCFGPKAATARIEGSKAFAKELMASAGVPTAAWQEVETVSGGIAAIESYPAVLKFDGLAGGKGVVIAQSEQEARVALTEMLEQHRFGDGIVVVEEFMDGEELSLFALCDGERAVPLVPAQDYKRIGDGDEGPNTGGMGAYSPVEIPGFPLDPAELCAQIHQPVVDLLRERGTPYRGLLYAGLMITSEGVKVVEFNCRFGDPETQVVLPRLQGDLLAALVATTRPGGLAQTHLTFDDRFAVTVVLASAGYPQASSKGDVISGLDSGFPPEVEIVHAGTARREDGAIVTDGGRVLGVTALAATPAAARDAAYAATDQITFDGRQLRRDIAQRAVERSSR